MTTRYRAMFINSLSGFKSANLIGTRDKDGNTNLALFSSVVHLGADPALIGFVMRPDNGSRHTLENIIATNQYTINQVSADFYKAAHQSSARYSKEQSEFQMIGLTTSYVSNVSAPFVTESKLKFAMKLIEVMPIQSNNTQFIIGEITHVLCETGAVKQDGYIDIEALGTVSVSGLDSYHQTRRLSRLEYAKPDKQAQSLTVDGLLECDSTPDQD